MLKFNPVDTEMTEYKIIHQCGIELGSIKMNRGEWTLYDLHTKCCLFQDDLKQIRKELKRLNKELKNA